MGLLLAAPCQCLTSGGNQTTSPGRTSCTGPFHSCTNPLPEVTISVCPSGWLCHAVLAPGLNSTEEPDARAGTWVENRCSIRTVPVKHSAGPGAEGCSPRWIKCACAYVFLYFVRLARTLVNTVLAACASFVPTHSASTEMKFFICASFNPVFMAAFI